MQSRVGPPYAGAAGRTRTDRVHLVASDGSLRTIEVYRVVNTSSHPELKALVLAGQLHRLEDGRELAIPFVYHDPVTRRFALVVPMSLAHLEMKEWASLMSEIAADTDHPVPAYVRDCTTVVGLGALEMFLESGVEPADDELTELASAPGQAAAEHAEQERALHDRERMLLEREREVSDQEQSLIRLASDLTSRESSLLRREEQLTTARADLEMREADISGGAVHLADHDAAVVPDGEWQEVVPQELATPLQASRRFAIDEESFHEMRLSVPVEEPTVVAALARVAGQSPQTGGVFSEPGLATPPHSTDPPPLPGRFAPPPLRSARPAPRSTLPPPLRGHTDSSSGRLNAPASAARVSAAPPTQPSPGFGGAARSTLAQRQAEREARAQRVSNQPDAETRVVLPAVAQAATSVAMAPAPVGVAAPLAHPSPAIDPELQSCDVESLHSMLKDSQRRLQVFLELSRRRDPSSVNPVFSTLDQLPADQVVYAVACLAVFGERAVEALIAGLGSPSAPVRQSCAVALGRLKLRRGLAPLLEQLEAEPTPSWHELARALGDFGLAALRALGRGIHGSSRRERLMVALAHLANHGCAQDLENMERDQDAVLALAAKQALARRSRLDWEDRAVRQGGTLHDATPEARLSQALYAILEQTNLP